MYSNISIHDVVAISLSGAKTGEFSSWRDFKVQTKDGSEIVITLHADAISDLVCPVMPLTIDTSPPDLKPALAEVQDG